MLSPKALLIAFAESDNAEQGAQKAQPNKESTEGTGKTGSGKTGSGQPLSRNSRTTEIHMPTDSRDAHRLKIMMEFHRENKEAMELCERGVGDYVAARCLILNAFLSEGLTLAAQGVEKVLKSQYRLRKGTSTFRDLGHSISDIAKRLLDETQFDLSQFDDLFQRLERNYSLRYPDNWKEGNWGQSTDEIDELDELFLHLFDDFPIMNEVNMLTCYFGIIANHLQQPDVEFYSLRFRWLTTENKAISHEYQRVCTAINEV